MPDVKDKNSGSRLNPSESNFDDMVNQPDMQALNDRGDAITRDNEASKLRDAENGATSENNEAGVDGKSKSAKEPENKFGYQANDKQENKLTQQSKRKKLIGLGLGGGAVGGLLISLFMLLPLKIPGIMQLVTDQTAQRLEQITERRAKTIMGRAILTKFGSHTGIVVTGDGSFSSLIASMRTAKFEERLAAKGLTIEQSGGDGVRIRMNGELISNATLRTDAEVLKAMDGKPLTNKLIKTMVKEDIPTWRWMKRAKFAQWLRWKYNVPRFGLTNSSETNPDDKKTDIDRQRVQATNQRVVTNFKEIMTCILSGTCNKVEGSETSSKKADQAQEAVKDVEVAASESDTTKSMTKILIGKFSTTAGTKAIPIIGWIDLLATLDHFANETIGENDFFGKVAAYYKGAAYAGIYADWAGYGSQVQLGAMDPDTVGTLSNELDGAEQAELFQAVQGNLGAGTPIEVKVDSDKPSNVKQLYDNILNSPAGLGNKYIGHPILNAYYETIGGGGLLGWISGEVGGIISKLVGPLVGVIGSLTPDAVKDRLTETIAKLGPVILKTFGLTIDAFDKGAALFNNIFAGGVVSANQYCESIDCRKLSPAQTSIQNQSIAKERAEYREQKGMLYALFSTEEPSSLTSQLAVQTPSSPISGLTSFGRLVSSIPTKLTSFIIPKTGALGTTYETIVGVQAFGATDADLNSALSEEFLTGDECPEVAEGDYGGCTIDTAVAEAMSCELTPDSDICAGKDEAEPIDSTGAGSAFRVGTYNISVKMGPSDWEQSANNIKKNNIDIVGTQELEKDANYRLIQRRMKEGGEYGIYPDKKPGEAIVRHGLNARAILYRTAKFEFMKAETFRFPRYASDGGAQSGDEQILAGQANAPIVWLRDKTTGQTVIAMNTHNAAFVENAERRYKSGLIYIEQITRLQKENPGVPIVFTGDFNEGTGVRGPGQGANRTFQLDYRNLLYCMFAENKLMKNSEATSRNRPTVCPNQSIGGVDYIYATPEITARSFTEIPRGLSGSDHPAKYVDLEVPGTGAETTGGWAWPVDKKWWTTSKEDFLGAHTLDSQTFTSPSVNGIAADIGNPPDGSPIYAMLSGKVVRTNLCGAGEGMIIESVTPAGILRIAYAHGTQPRFKVGESVQAGLQILNLGAVGCKVSGGHLHVDMALDNKHICPQDVFLALGVGTDPDLATLTTKGVAPCGR